MPTIPFKKNVRLRLAAWLGSTRLIAALYIACAILAGWLSLSAQHSGPAAAVAGLVLIGLSLALLRAHFRQQTLRHDALEARLVAAERTAAHTQKRFHAAFTHASIGMAIVSFEGIILRANRSLCALLRSDEALMLNTLFRDLLHPGDVALLDRQVADVLERRANTFSIELRCRRTDQRETWVSLHCALFDDHASAGGGAGTGLIFQLHDITSRRRTDGELHHIAYHDSLTDLANRSCFLERLSMAVERSRTDLQYSFAVMYLDLDRFKIINDSLGHSAGDEMLKEVARRLSACIRPTDLVARLGGDEFAILLEAAYQPDDVTSLGQRLLHALEQPVCLNGTDVRTMASIGVTFSDLGYREPDEVLRDADLAMYKAKADGKGRLALFDVSLHEQLGHKRQVEADLRRAIGGGQLSLAFQPLFELEPYGLIGFEALTRWVHPVRGAISPADFIALAEETGCIEALTQWAIDEAVQQLAVWRRQSAHHHELVIHVNVSGKDLARPSLVPHVRDVLQRHTLPARLLTLEVTESALMQQRELALRSLAGLCELGVRLGIDDFGTGYSSLACLSTLPFDCVKIHRSFVIGLNKSPQNVEIVRTILALGRSLNKQVIAEGIETNEQLLLLKSLGTPVGQGFLLGRPLSPQKAQELLLESNMASH